MLALAGFLIFFIVLLKLLFRWRRVKKLLAKYHDVQIVRMIMRRKLWEGMTKEHILDSIGRPVDIDSKFLKRKTRETWKYNETGKNRFDLRVLIENDIVVGWEKKH